MPEYSISQLAKFEECPLQYKFIYVDRIKRYEEGVEAFLGQRFHETMEWLYRERAFRVAPLEEVLAYYEKQWAENWHPDVKITRECRSADDYRLMGRRFIEDYYRSHHPFDEGRVLGLERYVRFPLDPAGRHNCKGIIDRLMLAPDGAFEIHDYKTGSGLPDQRQLDSDRQLALYQVGVQALWPEARQVRLVWHYVAFGMDMRSSRTPADLETLKAELGALIDRIEAELEFAPRENALCGWCAYQDLCSARKHLVKVKALPKDKWKDEPGVVLVDAYAERWRKKKGLGARHKELDREIRALDDELGELREAAIAFAVEEGASVIAGSDAHLRIRGRDTKAWPPKGTEAREALERALRAAGVWDEVATLDCSALEKAVAEGRWPHDICECIKAHLNTERRYTVTLKEKED